MDARELEPDSDGFPWNAVVEHGPQAVGTCQRRADILQPRLVERDTRRRDVHDRARRVVAEARLFDERLLPPVRVALPRPRLLPWPRGARAAPAPGRPLRRCRWPSPARRLQEAPPRTIGRAEQGVRNSSAEECGRDPNTVRRELIQRQIGVGERLLDPLRHHVRAQRGDPRLDRGAAVRERDLRSRPVGEGEPALSVLGSPRQRTPPGSIDGERGVVHKLVVAEPPEPLLHGLQAAVVVERRTEGVDQAGDGVRLAALLDRSRPPPRAGRWRRTRPSHGVERGHHIRLAPLELVPQQLAEQVVVAIPLAPPVEGHHEAVRARERLEHACRPRRLEHGVAKTAAHAIQDRCVLEELRLGRRQPGEELETEVVGHEAVVAGEDLDARRLRRPGLKRERREVQAGRPAFRPLGQLGELARVELDARSFQQQLGLLLAQPEVSHADLLHPSLCPPAGERQRRLFPARDRDLRAGRNVLEERREHVQTGRIGDSV